MLVLILLKEVMCKVQIKDNEAIRAVNTKNAIGKAYINSVSSIVNYKCIVKGVDVVCINSMIRVIKLQC